MSIIGAPLRAGKGDDITTLKMVMQGEVNWGSGGMKVEILGDGALPHLLRY
jgi:hypothetical protein